MSAARAYLVDASIYIFRAYFSLPDRWHSPQGQPLNALLGYARFVLDFLGATQVNGVSAFAFDQSLGSCFRNEIYPDYKSSRALPDEDLAFQLEACYQFTQSLGIPVFASERYEADDYLAALAQCAQRKKYAVTVVTRDKDLGQLLQSNEDCWWDYAGDLQMSALDFQHKFGVKPDQFADYLALVGDSSDDIPGVPGVGPKSAAILLQHFATLADLESNLSKVSALPLRGAARIAKLLKEYWPQVLLARQLTGFDVETPAIQHLPTLAISAENLDQTQLLLANLSLARPLQQRMDKLRKALSA